MGEDSVKEYLESQINKKYEQLKDEADMLHSMILGSEMAQRADPLDLTTALSLYKGLIEINTMFGIYNRHYYNADMADGQKQAQLEIEETEKHLNELFTVIVNTINE